MSKALRKPVVAGVFYPKTAKSLDKEVRQHLAEARRVFHTPPSQPRAIISPHAGYDYCGVLTAAAHLMTQEGAYKRVVILSPSHKHAFEGLALPSQDGYSMPGFDVPILKTARTALLKQGLAVIDDAAHANEHGIEIQLPFIHALHPKARIVPIVIGRSDVSQIAAVIDHFSSTGTLFVLSSDLSHFLPQLEARRKDRETARLIETAQFGRITSQHACGSAAIRGYLASEAGQGARTLRVGLSNSSRHSGNTDRLVGYGAWTIHDQQDDILNDLDRAELLRVARHALWARLRTGKVPNLDLSSFSPRVLTTAASFVTLTVDGKLRGCIGSMAPTQPLVQDVITNALRAGFSDQRFAPLTAAEFQRAEIKISVLTSARAQKFKSEAQARRVLQTGVSGAILTCGKHRGVFLPQVWDSLKTKKDFLNGLKRKAGLSEDFWSDDLKLHLFQAECFADPAPIAVAA